MTDYVNIGQDERKIMMEISVIMATYKEKIELLKVAIESILKQTYNNFEFIIILDNPENIEHIRCIENYQKNVRDAKQALVTCKEIVSRYDVNMQLTNCEYTLDKAKVIFMYTSDDRVDFRELLKELAVVFKCRIELRQIGPRDKAKVIGGIGTCGLPLCCSTLLGEFNGVSINMAKNQMLAINIEKISGACGRLMCCLKYEDEIYSLEKERFPKIGSHVKYQDKDVKVTGLNVINDLVKIETNNGIVFVGLDEIKFDKNNHAGKKNGKPRSH